MIQVLVVDTELLTRQYFVSLLNNTYNEQLDNTYMITTADSWFEAREKLSRIDYDLLFLNVTLPDVNGIDILKILGDLYPNLLTVMMAGYPTIDTIVKAIKYGAVDYLIKPINSENLKAVLIRVSTEKALKDQQVYYETLHLQLQDQIDEECLKSENEKIIRLVNERRKLLEERDV